MSEPTKSQQIMIGDGLPTAASITQEERRESWKGLKLTRPSAASVEKPKGEDPVARKLRREHEAAEARKTAERLRLLYDNQKRSRDDARAVKEAAMAAQQQAATTAEDTDMTKPQLKAMVPTTRGNGSSAKKKQSKHARARAGKEKAGALSTARAAAAKKQRKPVITAPSGGRVSGQQVADFVCRAGGASMEELVAQFGIEAHPMRAKVFYVRHTLGYEVEVREGRYHGTAPKGSK